MMRERGMMREGGGQEAGCEYLIISHQDWGRIYSLPLQGPGTLRPTERSAAMMQTSTRAHRGRRERRNVYRWYKTV